MLEVRERNHYEAGRKRDSGAEKSMRFRSHVVEAVIRGCLYERQRISAGK